MIKLISAALFAALASSAAMADAKSDKQDFRAAYKAY